MRKRIHGGDWAGFREEFGQAPLDFSASISPLGVPSGVARAAGEAARHADCYPDPKCRKLTAAIAEREQVPASSVLCGAGAADLIWRAVLAIHPRTAWTQAPTFGEYRAALEQVNCKVTHNERADVDMIILCNPNNPTGKLTPPENVLQMADCGVPMLLDECFLDFTDIPSANEFTTALADYPNVLVLKAFTKLYAMAGFRLGYVMCSDSALLDRVAQAGPPWAVSTVAQAAGLAALQETSYVQQVRTLVKTEREWLLNELEALGLETVPGCANYILFRAGYSTGESLRKRGILVRTCGDFEGLDESWIRIAVRTHEDNETLICTLKEVLA